MNQTTITGMGLCHKKVQCPCFKLSWFTHAPPGLTQKLPNSTHNTLFFWCHSHNEQALLLYVALTDLSFSWKHSVLSVSEKPSLYIIFITVFKEFSVHSF